MSVGAIIMMCVACVGLWGGILVSMIVMSRANRKKSKAMGKLTEESFMQSVAGDIREMGHVPGEKYEK